MSNPQPPWSETVGVIPAAGRATRLDLLPCSKEVFPIGFRVVEGETLPRPKTVCHYLLEKMRLAGIQKTYMVLRSGKWDIPAYLQSGSLIGMDLAYLIAEVTNCAPDTLNYAFPFVREARVVLGFPDILFQPEDAFVQLLAAHAQTQADVQLGLFPAPQPDKLDMVAYTASGRVEQILNKPATTDLQYGWGIAVWTPAFTQFMHDYVGTLKSDAAVPGEPSELTAELSIGDVIQAAIMHGLQVEAAPVSDTPFLDIGTPQDLVRAVQQFAIPNH